MRRITAQDIETAVADYFGYRQNMIVPNVSWGLFNHMEVDLLIVRPSGYAVEVEIKVSAADIKADTLKSHQHKSRLLRQLWFAVPEALATNALIPERAGILSLSGDGSYDAPLRVVTARAPEVNKDARKLTEREIQTLGRLAAMRIWALKHSAIARRNEREYQREAA